MRLLHACGWLLWTAGCGGGPGPTAPQPGPARIEQAESAASPQGMDAVGAIDPNDPVEAPAPAVPPADPANNASVPRGARCLLAAYPDHLCGYGDGALRWCDGTTTPYGRVDPQRSHEERLQSASPAEQMAQAYVPGPSFERPIAEDFEPGRVRHQPMFEKMYGGSAAEVRAKLREVTWLPGASDRKLRVSGVNAVASALQRVSERLKAVTPEHRKLAAKIAGTFNWRTIKGTERLSTHSFAIAIDAGMDVADYWRWAQPSDGGRYPYRNRLPWPIVAAFEAEGFVWGGKWYHYDTMHFEYRPELLVEECVARPAGLWLGGDVLVGEGRTRLFDASLAMLRSEPGVVNLEGPIAPGGNTRRDGTLLLRNDPRAPQLLREGGVTGVSLANNHAADGGAGVAGATRARLDAEAFGVADADRDLTLSIRAARVILIARDLSASIPPDLAAAIHSADQRAEIVVVSFHVTGPPSHLPSPEVRGAVDAALAAGAHVVVLHGSHVVGPVERRGDAIIAWGLGNLVFDCDCTDETQAIVLQVWRTAAGGLGAAVLPVRAGLRGQQARISPEPGDVRQMLQALGSSPLHDEAGRFVF